MAFPRKPGVVWLGLVALAALLVVQCGVLRLRPETAPRPTPTPAGATLPAPVQAPPASPQGMPPVAEVVARVTPAVVSIAAETQGVDIFLRPIRGVSTGTGVLFDPAGYIVTNDHVIANARRVQVTLSDERTFEARIVGRDPLTDLAVLKINAPEPLPALSFADPDTVQVGEWVIAIGNALGLPGEPTVTVGVVSAVNRSTAVGDRVYNDLVQTDAAINEGNSGGPLVNMRGEVVGINTIVVREAQGIGFAVGNTTVVPVVRSIVANGRVVWPWLGVGVDNVTPGKALELGLAVREGVLVQGVQRNSPAAKGGIQPGDVITALNGIPVQNVRKLQRLLREEFKVGQHITVTIQRGNQTLERPVILEEFPRPT
ncbi:MAG: trypsin-like peptidase domain-containing protein [Dehalococcoidia bacterium]|nr:trypsin-like peptidase domain-containing protein [Dehalococcoidia bacterium]MDW8119821.1 trypsin-like peptidase domain-containing protein [Chloroflexota bacterium]